MNELIEKEMKTQNQFFLRVEYNKQTRRDYLEGVAGIGVVTMPVTNARLFLH